MAAMAPTMVATPTMMAPAQRQARDREPSLALPRPGWAVVAPSGPGVAMVRGSRPR